jgi:methionine-rich copper-binding protein CopC
MMRVLAVMVMLLFFSAPASASPALKDASPRAGSTVSVAPKFVRLTFDRPVAGGGPYSITVSGGGQVWTESRIGVDGGVVTVPLRHSLPSGEYEVSYEVTPPGGVAVAGQYRFELGGSSGTPVWVWVLIGVMTAGAIVTAFRLAGR